MQTIGSRVIYLEVTDSTNSEVWRRYRSGDFGGGEVLYAGHQTAGRGQQGNRWESEAGVNLLASILLKPRRLAVQRIFHLNILTALAIRDTLAEYLPSYQLMVKWPNDVMAGQAKIAGILIETQLQANRVVAAVAGLGINVNQDHFPPQLTQKATSLKQEMGRTLWMPALLETLVVRMEYYFRQMENEVLEWLRTEYHRYLYLHHQERLFQANGSTFRGQIRGVDQEGNLMVQSAQGVQHYPFKSIELL